MTPWSEKTEAPYPKFPSLPRFFRDVVITEKIDGTNALVHVAEDGTVRAGSRTRWITPQDDNYGFARWVAEREDSLRLLGTGNHYGEWWGSGIQRRYGLDEKRFSLFNTKRWTTPWNTHVIHEPGVYDLEKLNTTCIEVPVCHVVPILYAGILLQIERTQILALQSDIGSLAAKGFTQPEGIVIYHVAAEQYFKVTLDKNDGHKGA